MLERAVASGQISEADLFDEAYKPIPSTRPQKYSTRFDALTDRLFPVQERLLDGNGEMVHAIGTDRNGYVPTHNKRFCQPLTGDYNKDIVGSRTKRIFDDPVGQCGKNQMPFRSRPTAGIPARSCTTSLRRFIVNGRHWGGFRMVKGLTRGAALRPAGARVLRA